MQMYTILKYTILGLVCFLVRLICELCLRIGEITSYDLGFLSAIFLDGCRQIKIHVPFLNKTDNAALMQ